MVENLIIKNAQLRKNKAGSLADVEISEGKIAAIEANIDKKGLTMAEIQGANIVKLVTKQAGRAKEKVSKFSNFSTCKDLCIHVKNKRREPF